MFRGAGKSEAQSALRNCEDQDRVPQVPIGENRCLRVVNGHKHLGAIASAALRFAPKVAAKITADSAIEKSLSKSILLQSRLPRSVQLTRKDERAIEPFRSRPVEQPLPAFLLLDGGAVRQTARTGGHGSSREDAEHSMA